jgi:hypothetical protein
MFPMIVVGWNNKNALRYCPSFLNALSYRDFEVFTTCFYFALLKTLLD